jgi:UDP-N-acetylmuramate-alanine ligase
MFFTLSQDAVGIINADDKRLIDFLKRKMTRLITYGFNSTAYITASSIQEEELNNRIQCCVQKKLTTFSGKVLEPQEFSITLPLSQNHELYSALAAITAAMLNDRKISQRTYR